MILTVVITRRIKVIEQPIKTMVIARQFMKIQTIVIRIIRLAIV